MIVRRFDGSDRFGSGLRDSCSAGFMTMDCSRAREAGLSIRPLARTIEDTAAWLAARDNAGAWKNVITGAAERALLPG